MPTTVRFSDELQTHSRIGPLWTTFKRLPPLRGAQPPVSTHRFGGRGIFLLVAGAGISVADESVEQLETQHAAALQSFETETRTELTRIARDKSITGEEKIIRTEKWFSTQADRIAHINTMADSLDERKPIVRSPRPPRPADRTPEGIAAENLHRINLSMSTGGLSADEFDRLRKPIMDHLCALPNLEKPARPRLPARPLTRDLNVLSKPEELARELHAQNRYLASLPKEEAAELCENKNSPVSRLLQIILGSSGILMHGF